MDDPRKRCIQETIALCSSQGLDFTMSELAARLGMSKKTLYVLFDSKEALLLATSVALGVYTGLKLVTMMGGLLL